MGADHSVKILYKNHRGTVAVRHVVPERIFFGETPYHKGEQWFLTALDLDKKETRDFAMADIHGWFKTGGH